MKERPILMSVPMVRSSLDGSKTQTRRVMKHQPPSGEFKLATIMSSTVRGEDGKSYWAKLDGLYVSESTRPLFICPYGHSGDRLWVRESGRISIDKDAFMYFDHGGKIAPTAPAESESWAREWKPCPSIHMPRWASRITLEITGVRVERLQDISEEDCIAEGIEAIPNGFWRLYGTQDRNATHSPQESYRSLWESINGAESWDANPWVWVVEFRRIQ